MRRSIILLAFILNAIPALAAPITIDVTGTLSAFRIFDNSADGMDRLGTLADLSVQGSVTFDRSLAPPPITVGAGVPSYRQGSMGTPLVEFVSATLTWANGTFVPTPFIVPPGALEAGDTFLLQNFGSIPDELALVDEFSWSMGLERRLSRISFVFRDDFIAGSGIPTGEEFPDLASASGQAFIALLDFGAGGALNGFVAEIDLTSARARAVSEPATLGSLALGLCGLWFSRRRFGRDPR